MDFNDIIPTLKYAASTPTRTLLEQLRKELEDTYAKENPPPFLKDSQLASGYEAQRKMDEYTGVNVKSAKAADMRMELEKERRKDEYEKQRRMGLLEEEEPSKAGVIMTPEVVKELEEKRQKLIQTRTDLERQRRMNEYDQRARARRMKVQDTLEKTGLDRR